MNIHTSSLYPVLTGSIGLSGSLQSFSSSKFENEYKENRFEIGDTVYFLSIVTTDEAEIQSTEISKILLYQYVPKGMKMKHKTTQNETIFLNGDVLDFGTAINLTVDNKTDTTYSSFQLDLIPEYFPTNAYGKYLQLTVTIEVVYAGARTNFVRDKYRGNPSNNPTVRPTKSKNRRRLVELKYKQSENGDLLDLQNTLQINPPSIITIGSQGGSKAQTSLPPSGQQKADSLGTFSIVLLVISILLLTILLREIWVCSNRPEVGKAVEPSPPITTQNVPLPTSQTTPGAPQPQSMLTSLPSKAPKTTHLTFLNRGGEDSISDPSANTNSK